MDIDFLIYIYLRASINEYNMSFHKVFYYVSTTRVEIMDTSFEISVKSRRFFFFPTSCPQKRDERTFNIESFLKLWS